LGGADGEEFAMGLIFWNICRGISGLLSSSEAPLYAGEKSSGIGATGRKGA
jgi:hypothetical protein